MKFYRAFQAALVWSGLSRLADVAEYSGISFNLQWTVLSRRVLHQSLFSHSDTLARTQLSSYQFQFKEKPQYPVSTAHTGDTSGESQSKALIPTPGPLRGFRVKSTSIRQTLRERLADRDGLYFMDRAPDQDLPKGYLLRSMTRSQNNYTRFRPFSGILTTLCYGMLELLLSTPSTILPTSLADRFTNILFSGVIIPH